MRRSSGWADDRGSAALEFITAGVLLLVPLVYLVLALSAVQGAALATEGAARQAARVYARADDDATGRREAEAAVDVALADRGVAPDGIALDITCGPDPTRCHAPRSLVHVSVRVAARLPLAPPVAGPDAPAAVAVSGAADERISVFTRGSGS
jgi:Flp pilus assembly protein TadG